MELRCLREEEVEDFELLVFVGDVPQSSIVNSHGVTYKPVPLFKVGVHHIKELSLLRNFTPLVFWGFVVSFWLLKIHRKAINALLKEISDALYFLVPESVNHLSKILDPNLILVRPGEDLQSPLEHAEGLFEELAFGLQELYEIQDHSRGYNF